MPPSLYIHIPFCLKRCIYCDFISGIYDSVKAKVYIEALEKDILKIPDKTSFGTLYLGGGTPTALQSDILRSLLSFIQSNFYFQENEATIEANPGTLDKNKVHILLSSGINRISIGVQSFNNNELDILGRIHSSEDAEEAIRLASNSGFDNIGIDLIYGIPGQDIASWKKTLEKALSLKPKHISTYELTVEPGTLLHTYCNTETPPPPSLSNRKTLNENKIKLLDEDMIIDMYNHTIDYLTSAGFKHYEISNFAQPDYYCKHNLNYWNRGEYYGAGLGAHSFISGKRFYNTEKLDEYIKIVSENKNPVKNSERISKDKELSEAIFLGLRKTDGINIESLSKQFKINISRTYDRELNDLQKAGLIETSVSDCLYETNLRLTRKGLVLSNEVFMRFI